MTTRQAGRGVAGTAGSVLVAIALLTSCAQPNAGAADDPSALSAAREFLDGYVDPDGRVVRRDQGGDTVSEGQSYGLMLAVAVDDRALVRLIWDWTRTNLGRSDGLLSWQWRDGAVVDPNSAADADLDTARALVLAGERFDDPAFAADGRALATAVLAHETAPVDAGRMLLAGNWARTQPYDVNPSYLAPEAARQLSDATGDPRWQELVTGGRELVESLVDGAALPPDWVRLDAAGTPVAVPGPDGQGPHYGLDAPRLLLRFTESCDVADRELAARAGAPLADDARPVGRYALDGSPQVEWSHPLSLVAAAAGAQAAGDQARADQLLDDADALDAAEPGYYGSAWVALGRVLLSTDLLGGCAADAAAAATKQGR